VGCRRCGGRRKEDASVTILDDDSLLDGAKLLELLTKRILISVPCEAANEEL
jgi:hypothetical protein